MAEAGTITDDLSNWWDKTTKKVGDYFDPATGGFVKMLGTEEKKFGVQPESAEYYQDRNVGRRQILEDIKELQRLQRTGGAATREAKELQRVAAKGQRGLHRGLGLGGRGERMGAEAAGESYVQAMGPVAMVKEAETAGYSKQEATAAGLLVMEDKKFQDALDKAGGDIARGEAEATQAGRAQFISNASKVAGAIFALSDERAKTNIRPISKAAPKDFLEKLNTGGFDYRPEFGGERGRMGPLLNEEVANTEVGRSFIRRDPQTGYLMTDPNAAALTTMALLKEQNERLETLEQASPGAAYARRYPQSIPLPGTPYVPVAKTDIPGTPGASLRKIPGRFLPFRDLPPSPGGVYTKGARPGASPQPQESGFTQEDAKSFMDMLSKGKKGKK